MENYTAIKRDGMMQLATLGVEVEGIMLSEMNKGQIRKKLSHLWDRKNHGEETTNMQRPQNWRDCPKDWVCQVVWG